MVERRYGADDNLIEGNIILASPTGIWAGSRMAENQYFMDCSDPAYVSGALTAVHLDHAEGNTIRDNRIGLVDNAIRVEDDATTVTGNYIEADDPTDRGILIGTKHRTEVLDQPVSATVVTDNDVVGPDGVEAYGWVHGHTATTFTDNTLNGSTATLQPGTQPTINPFLFVIKVGSVTPTGRASSAAVALRATTSWPVVAEHSLPAREGPTTPPGETNYSTGVTNRQVGPGQPTSR